VRDGRGTNWRGGGAPFAKLKRRRARTRRKLEKHSNSVVRVNPHSGMNIKDGIRDGSVGFGPAGGRIKSKTGAGYVFGARGAALVIKEVMKYSIRESSC